MARVDGDGESRLAPDRRLFARRRAKLVRDLNRLYGPEDALWEADGEPAGFEWIDVNNASENIVSFTRRSPKPAVIICVCNFSAVPKKGYRVPQLDSGQYVLINTNAESYGGSGDVSVNDAEIDLPPLTTLWFAPRKATKNQATKAQKAQKEAHHEELKINNCFSLWA